MGFLGGILLLDRLLATLQFIEGLGELLSQCVNFLNGLRLKTLLDSVLLGLDLGQGLLQLRLECGEVIDLLDRAAGVDDTAATVDRAATIRMRV